MRLFLVYGKCMRPLVCQQEHGQGYILLDEVAPHLDYHGLVTPVLSHPGNPHVSPAHLRLQPNPDRQVYSYYIHRQHGSHHPHHLPEFLQLR